MDASMLWLCADLCARIVHFWTLLNDQALLYIMTQSKSDCLRLLSIAILNLLEAGCSADEHAWVKIWIIAMPAY
jgi:hypothetical protein